MKNTLTVVMLAVALNLSACVGQNITVDPTGSGPVPEVNKVDIVDYGLTLKAAPPNHYTFYGVIHNRADFPLRWPHIELILMDITNKPLARRIITPTEWVPTEKLATGRFAPYDKVSAQVDLEIPAENPKNYHVELIYPTNGDDETDSGGKEK